MTARRRAVLELALAAAVSVGCVLSWVRSRSTVDVAPIANGEPSTTSVAYYSPLLVLALVLATIAGVLVVVAVARLRRKDHADAADSETTQATRRETPT
jgi:Flp pilus assembly protein CpaB